MTHSSTSSKPLFGLQVLLMRPVGSARSFALGCVADGAHCVNLPLLSLRDLPDSRALQRALAEAERGDALVFASPNAVRACYRLRPRFRAPAVVFAQGPATARALRRHGVTPVLPEAGFTSEDLLRIPFFDRVAGKRIIRIAGIGGRDLLGETLAARGAQFTALAVYERVPARWDRRHYALMERLVDPVMVLSSAEALSRLPRLLAPESWRRVRSWRVLATSPRLQAAARDAGFTRVTTADSAASADLRAGLLALTEAKRVG